MDEFIDAYSDDQIYLSMIRELVDSHPVESLTPERIKLSSFCRLWAVMMVGSIESMIKVWDTGDHFWADIAAYFNRQSNEDRVEGLLQAFKLRGLEVDVELFKDFLAIKYIRNSYIHSEWVQAQKSYSISRGFPGDVMRFTQENFNHMQKVHLHIMNNLGTVHALNAINRST